MANPSDKAPKRMPTASARWYMTCAISGAIHFELLVRAADILGFSCFIGLRQRNGRGGTRTGFLKSWRSRRNGPSCRIGCGRILAQLQRPDVGDDLPAVFGRDLHGVIGHRSKAVRHYVEEITERRL